MQKMDVHLVQRYSTSHAQRLRKTSSMMNKSGQMEVRYTNGTSRRSPPLMSVDSDCDYEHGFTSFCSHNMHGFSQGKLMLDTPGKNSDILAATLRGSRPGVQSASLIMTSLMTS